MLRRKERKTINIQEAMNPSIDDAIKYYKGMIFPQDMSAHTLRAVAMNQLAIKALQEQAERAENKPLTLDELRQMDGEPLWIEDTPSGDMVESEIEPIIFKGISCGKEERACWVTGNAHHANARIEHIVAGKINFYIRKPDKEKSAPGLASEERK